MSVERPLPAGADLLPKDCSPKQALEYFENNILGRTINTPDGESITLNIGHFFRLVCEGGRGKKGWVDGYDSSTAALAAIRRGEVAPDLINGYDADRGQMLPVFIDTVEHPAFEMQEKAEPRKTQFVKRFAADNGRGVVAAFRFIDGGRKIQSYHGFSTRRKGKTVSHRPDRRCDRAGRVSRCTWTGTSPAGSAAFNLNRPQKSSEKFGAAAGRLLPPLACPAAVFRP